MICRIIADGRSEMVINDEARMTNDELSPNAQTTKH